MKGGVPVGHQESLMFCDEKRNMIRLCNLLNKAAADTSERGMEYVGLAIYEIARLKKDVVVFNPLRKEGPIFPKGSYFIWWGGEQGPQAQDEFLISRAHRRMDWIPYWYTVYAEYVPATKMLEGIKEGIAGAIQENEWIRTFHPEGNNHIPLDLLEQL